MYATCSPLIFALGPKGEFHDSSKTLSSIISATTTTPSSAAGVISETKHSGQILNTEDKLAKYRPKSHNFYLGIVLSRTLQGLVDPRLPNAILKMYLGEKSLDSELAKAGAKSVCKGR